MADARYIDALLQVPSTEVPDDATMALRPFAIQRHGGMLAFRMGPVEGTEGPTYSVLISTGQAKAIVQALEVYRANLGC